MHRVFALKAVGFALAALVAGSPAVADFSPETVWALRCGTCHTVGGGDDVGPDLQGVTERRDREWLVGFIQSSTSMIESGDEIASGLFEQFGRQKMPDHPYAPDEIDELLAWIDAGGPEDRGPKIRLVSTATREEQSMGRELFFGERAFAAGGTACAACHTVEPGSASSSLGGDLSRAYVRYRDVELSYLLRGMGTPLMAETYGRRPLTEEEAFCIKAFLADPRAAGSAPSPRAPKEGRGLPWWLTVTAVTAMVVAGDGALMMHRRGDREGSS